MRRKMGLFALGMWMVFSVAAQKINFEHLSSDLGLSQNMINCIMQDSRGFIWVGTNDGLNRFDGYQFTTYKYDPFDSLSISSNEIISVLEDKLGRFWVATSKGIHLFDREKSEFHVLNTPYGKLLSEDPRGGIWQPTSKGLMRLTLSPYENLIEKAVISYIPLKDSSDAFYNTPVWDADGLGFVGGYGKSCYQLYWDSISQQPAGYKLLTDIKDYKKAGVYTNLLPFLETPWNNNFANTVEAGRNGTIWTSNGKNLIHWDARTHKNSLIPVPNTILNGLFKGSKKWDVLGPVLEDQQGRVWIGGFKGSFRVDVAKATVEDFSPDSSDINNPLAYGISALYEDQSGLIWLGSRGKGVLKFNDNGRRFEPGMKRTQSIRALFKTYDGRIWLAFAGAPGLYYIDPKNPELVRFAADYTFHGMPFGRAWSFVQDKSDALWISTDWGLMKITHWQNGASPKIEPFSTDTTYVNGVAMPTLKWLIDQFNADPQKTISDISPTTSMKEDAAGQLWSVSNKGLRCFDPRSKKVLNYLFFSEKGIYRQSANAFPTLFIDQSGRIWVGTGNEGLWLFNQQNGTFKKFQNDRRDPKSISHDIIKCIAEDPTEPGRYLFIGTGGGGLNRFDTQTGIFEKFTEKDGLPDMTIYAILPDEAGNIWMSTNKGLTVFNLKNRTFRNFDQRDGLQSLEFNTNAYYKAADGELFFGGIEGFNSFFPSKMLQANTHKPAIVFTDFKIAGKSVSHRTSGNILSVSISYAKKITIPADVKVFSFEFAAMDFAEPNKNQFACKMEGFDTDWQQLGNAHSVTYTNLSPGKYTFRVRGSNNDGVWNEEGANIEIEILAPWWATWWAKLLYLLGFSGLVYAFYQLQLRRNASREEAKREKVLNLTKSQFLSTVSHELRTPLTSILGFSKIVQKRLEERVLPKTDMSDPKTERAAAQVMENLGIVVSESERLTTLVNEVLDLSKIESGNMNWNNEKLNIEEIVERASVATSMLFAQKKLTLIKNIEPKLPQLNGDADRLQQVLVNLISNAVKFSQKGAITVSAKMKDEHNMLLSVADQGIGIPEMYHNSIFDRFVQVPGETRVGKTQGTGLGLSICKEIVEHHKGKIWVESKIGVGSIFWFTLSVK